MGGRDNDGAPSSVGWADVATKDDLRDLETALRKDVEALEARLNGRIMRTALMVNIPTVVAAVGLAFAAARLG